LANTADEHVIAQTSAALKKSFDIAMPPKFAQSMNSGIMRRNANGSGGRSRCLEKPMLTRP
jgi:hypothetical protein